MLGEGHLAEVRGRAVLRGGARCARGAKVGAPSGTGAGGVQRWQLNAHGHKPARTLAAPYQTAAAAGNAGVCPSAQRLCARGPPHPVQVRYTLGPSWRATLGAILACAVSCTLTLHTRSALRCILLLHELPNIYPLGFPSPPGTCPSPWRRPSSPTWARCCLPSWTASATSPRVCAMQRWPRRALSWRCTHAGA